MGLQVYCRRQHLHTGNRIPTAAPVCCIVKFGHASWSRAAGLRTGTRETTASAQLRTRACSLSALAVHALCHSAGQQKGVWDDLQLGLITLQPTTVANQDTCTQQVVDCPTKRNNCNGVNVAPTSKLDYWFDGATSTDTLEASSNIRVADDLPKGLDSGTSSFTRRCAPLALRC